MKFLFTLGLYTVTIVIGSICSGFFKRLAEELKCPEWAVELVRIVGFCVPIAALASFFSHA